MKRERENARAHDKRFLLFSFLKMKISSTTMSDGIVNIIHSDTFVQFEQTSNDDEIFFSSSFLDIHTYIPERTVENFLLLHFIDMIITSDKNIDDDHQH